MAPFTLVLIPAFPAVAALLIGLRFVRSETAIARCTLLALGLSVAAGAVAALLGESRLAAFATIAIGLIATIVGGFAARALAGGTTPFPRFFALVAATTAGALAVAVAGDLRVLAVAWIAVGACTSALLEITPRRPAAQAWARRHRLVESLGVLAWLAILALAWRAFGTFDLATIARLAIPGPIAVALGCAIVLAGATRSAIVPFHGWLPHSMEAPTPVSAFLHAGVVNGAGLLFAKTAFVLVAAPAALLLAALLGGLTATIGAVCALVRPESKRRLGWSTVAQMGFMVAQCGCGAFAAAVIHLATHGGYKSAAFLGVGGSIAERRRAVLYGERESSRGNAVATVFLAFAAPAVGLALAWPAAAIAGPLLPVAALAWAAAVCAARAAAERALPSRERWLANAAIAGALAAYLWSVIGLERWLGAELPHPGLLPAGIIVTIVAVSAGLLAGCGARPRLPDAAYTLALVRG